MSYPVPLSRLCINVITDDIRDIRDVLYLYEDGATSRPDAVVKGETIGDVVPNGWSIRDAALVQMVRSGKIGIDGAMAVENAHARATAIDLCGGWKTVVGKPVHQDSEGSLYSLPWLATKVLEVVCPSTGETYYLHVPPEINTASEARKWVNRGIDAELES